MMTPGQCEEIGRLMLISVTLGEAARLVMVAGHCPLSRAACVTEVPGHGPQPGEGHSVYSAVLQASADDEAYAADLLARLAGVLLVRFGAGMPGDRGPATVVEAWEDTKPGTAEVARLLNSTAAMFDEMAGKVAAGK